ncbi:MAG TPA: penicillin-binding protein activator LpoB [bacterium]|nr:penicillin-binding protein activator LpoB [bacterium]
MNPSLTRYGSIATALVLLAGCATTEGPITAGSGNVTYGDAKAVETVTNQFGSTDLQTIAEAMSRSMLQSAPVTRNNRPRVTIDEVQNKTSEYIDTRSITDTVRSQLLKSGQVRFVADINQMQGQTDELMRQNQTGLYKKSTTKKIGNMTGADYRVTGNISSIVKRSSDVKDVYYKFSLMLMNIETGEIEWADEKEIRKTSSR